MKFEPLTVRVSVGSPAVALDGDNEVIDGTGLGVTVNGRLFDDEIGTALTTVTWPVPGADIAGKLAVKLPVTGS